MSGFINVHTWEWIIGVSPHTGVPKTQTRKLYKIRDPEGTGIHGAEMMQWPNGQRAVCRYNDRTDKWTIKYQVGRTYPVHPKRGVKAVCHIVVDDIWEMDARLIDISSVRAEGFADKSDFWLKWTEMHDKEAFDYLTQYCPCMFEEEVFDYLMLRDRNKYQGFAYIFYLRRNK